MRARWALIGALAAGVAALVPATAPATGPAFTSDAPFVRDAAGRAVFFHGVNAVWKRAPYYPPSSEYSAGAVAPAQSYFDERDAQLMQQLGFNSIRLGFNWKGLEATRDAISEAYLDRYEELTDVFAPYGITVMLDLHQDMYNERFQGQGFPDWATHTGVAPDQAGVPLSQVAPPDEMARSGFPLNYFTPPVMRAFDNLWLDTFGTWEEFAEMWAAVAQRFDGKPNLIGYDLLNEPWPGSQWPSCANPGGCPGFDRAFLQRFWENAIAGIRGAGAQGIVWWEPNVTNDFGAANGVGLGAPVADSGGNLGLSFHTYCLLGGQFVPGLTREADPECPVGEQLTFEQQKIAGARNDSALFLTEFGASDELGDIERVIGWADDHMVSWHYWHYGSWADPTGNPQHEGMFGNDLQRFDDPATPQNESSLKQEKATVVSRPYPQAVAGTPTAFGFDPGTKVFHLTYAPDPAIGSAASPTEIFVAPRQYPAGYVVSTDGATQIACPSPRPHVVCLSNDGTGAVTVTITPAGPVAVVD